MRVSDMMSNTVKGQMYMEEARLNYDTLEQTVRKNLREKIDYLKTDGGKLCLLKPGAEKLCDHYGFAVQFELLESAGSHVREMAMYVVKAILTDMHSGVKVAEGLGMANSHESKYESQNSMNVANTILKMAKKRAMVDAVITAVHGSFLFTQDLEDMQSAYRQLDDQNGNNSRNGYQNQPKQQNQTSQGNNYGRNSGYGNKSQTTQSNRSGNTQKNNYNNSYKNNYNNNYNKNTKNNTAGSTGNQVTSRQINLIEKLISQQRISRDQVCMELEKRFQLIDYRSLDKQQASDFIQALQDMQPWAS